MYHTATETRRPTDRRVRYQKQLLIGSHSNTARTNYRTRVVLLPALLAGGTRVYRCSQRVVARTLHCSCVVLSVVSGLPT